MDPQMTEIVNCQLTKKDLMELLESERENELDAQIKAENKQIKLLKTESNVLFKELQELKTKEEAKLSKQAKTVGEKVLKSLSLPLTTSDGISLCETDTKIILVPDAESESVYTSLHEYNTTWYSKVKEITVSATIRVNVNGDTTSVNFLKKIQCDIPEQVKEKLLELDYQVYSFAKAIAAQEQVVRNLRHTQANLKGEMKTLSAGITRTALAGNDKGKAVLDLLAKLRNEAKKQITV